MADATENEVYGGLAEWSKAAVLKTVEPRGSRGSNPWPTAITQRDSLTQHMKVAKGPCGPFLLPEDHLRAHFERESPKTDLTPP